MRRMLSVLMLCCVCVFSSGCFVMVQRPLDTNYEKTELGNKIGEASMHTILFGLVAWGDAGSKAAAENGGIKVLNHADQKIFSVMFGVYGSWTTVVYGD